MSDGGPRGQRRGFVGSVVDKVMGLVRVEWGLLNVDSLYTFSSTVTKPRVYTYILKLLPRRPISPAHIPFRAPPR